MRLCKTCGGEIKPISGGKPISASIGTSYLGTGSGPAHEECYECRKEAYVKAKEKTDV
jgi:hypothetical protein